MQDSPVIVGGVGGSGTRIISEALIEMSFDMGHTLNHASDNLLFTLLFKRKDWLLRNLDNDKVMDPLVETFFALSKTDTPMKSHHYYEFFKVLIDWLSRKETVDGLGRRFAYKNARKIFANRRNKPCDMPLWGWKEPNSWLLLPHFKRAFPNMKYIHTIRHGVDMSLSNNQQQCINWSQHLVGQTVSNTSCSPSQSLHFWVEANRRVLEFGNTLPASQFLVVKFEDLCLKPESEMQKVVDFLDVDISEETRLKVLGLPDAVKSQQKFTNNDLKQYEEKDLVALSEFGYST